MRRLRLPLALLLVLSLLAAACGDDSGDNADETPDDGASSDDGGDDGGDDGNDDGGDDTAAGDDSDDARDRVPATFTTHVSAGQVTVTGADPGTELGLSGREGVVQTGIVDDLGNLLFRQVEPGEGWFVLDETQDPVATSDPLTVPSLDDHPDAEWFAAQTFPSEFAIDDTGTWEGYGYIETRDGTLLAATVRLPGPPEDGPYPTVVEYSGYDPASPYAVEPAINIYGLLGWATVGVNMRGSGCSGGAYDYFEPLQTIDGYDMIETIAAQDWVYENKVGMVGISYSGISQLFVAQTQPPSLAAITPISVIEDSYRSVVYPGGIYNNGFAKSWGDSRQGANDAYGQGWVNDRIAEGDTICDENQLLRSQNQDLATTTSEFSYYPGEDIDYLSPRLFVDQITVPTFLAGAWQDEQTGGRFPTMLDEFTGTDVFHAHLYNGAHADSLGPASLLAATELLSVYVADRDPTFDPVLRLGAPLLYADVFGVAAQLPPDNFGSYEEAKAAFEAGTTITVFLENGGNPDALGAPVPRGQVVFDEWPVAEAELQTWSLADLAGGEAVGEFTVDVEQSQELTKAADEDGDEFENLDWALLEDGEALVFETDAFTEDLLLIGTGRVSLSIMADEADADIEVTVTEVRPDGYEMYVQSGWLRASHRALDDTETTENLPWHLHSEEAAEELPAGEFTQIDVEIFPAGHVFRAGSKLRLIVDPPGGNRNLWAFDVLPNDGTAVQVDPAASTLTLPFVSGVDVPDGLSDCEHTRSQPCRMYVAYENRMVS
ncbi:MAG: CocE/NonD family hydrolase [Acidimicrobiales bacterium]|nr:CocE/NonD family hydrolase [Acidimicrobiales bacterium]